jgi:hypothetical protein
MYRIFDVQEGAGIIVYTFKRLVGIGLVYVKFK